MRHAFAAFTAHEKFNFQRKKWIGNV